TPAVAVRTADGNHRFRIRIAVGLFEPDVFLTALCLIEVADDLPGAEAGVAPAMFRVIGKQPWVELVEAVPTGGAGTLGGKQFLARGFLACSAARGAALPGVRQRIRHDDQAIAQV